MLGVVLPSSPEPSAEKDRVVYLSAAITTGTRMYKYLTEHKLTDPSLLKVS